MSLVVRLSHIEVIGPPVYEFMSQKSPIEIGVGLTIFGIKPLYHYTTQEGPEGNFRSIHHPFPRLVMEVGMQGQVNPHLNILQHL